MNVGYPEYGAPLTQDEIADLRARWARFVPIDATPEETVRRDPYMSYAVIICRNCGKAHIIEDPLRPPDQHTLPRFSCAMCEHCWTARN